MITSYSEFPSRMKGATIADFYERFIVEEIPSSYSESPKRLTISAASEIGSLKVNQLASRHFSISKIDMHFKYNTIIEVNDNLSDKVGFYMLDYGRGGTPSFGGFSNSSSVSCGECYLAFNPSLNEIHRFDAQSAKPFYLEVNAEYFASILDGGDKFMGKLKDKIYNREFFGMKSNLSEVQRRAATAIYDCPLEGSLGNLMIEGSLQQFVALQLTSFVHPVRKTETLSGRDKDTMHAVKEYLQGNFLENHSLLGLSKQFAINQSKLKKSFRELFGVPVIEYLYNLKMEHARILLCDHGMFVSEVSAMVGYKNANHFATAFKRKFGMNPSKV